MILTVQVLCHSRREALVVGDSVVVLWTGFRPHESWDVYPEEPDERRKLWDA